MGGILRKIGADPLGLTKKPKPVAPPPLPPEPAPAAIPEVGLEVEGAAVRKARRRKGFARTILTGALEPATKKKTLLG